MTYLAIALLVILQALDLWTTYKILGNGGREKNPVARWLLARLGWAGLIGLKLLFSGAAAAILLLQPYLEVYAAFGIILFLYIYVVGNNLMVMRAI